MTREIPLSRGKVAIVDDDDYEWLARYKWHISIKGYASRTEPITKKTIRMHRAILGLKDDEQGDHINGDRLDNRRCNLRKCTQAQNAINSTSRRNSTSRFKGVSWNEDKRKWQVEIQISKTRFYLGSYKSEIDAARAYNEAALKYHGDFARLNDIP